MNQDDRKSIRSTDRRELVVSAAPLAPKWLDAARTPPVPPRNSGVTPTFVLQVLARWWHWVLPAGLLLGGAGAAIGWLTFQPTFVAEAWVRIEDRRPYVAFPTQEESTRFVQTQVEMLRSPVVVTQCLTQPEIAQLPELKNELDP